MNRLRLELLALSVALPVWMAITRAETAPWLLAIGTVMGWMTAVALTMPRPWD